MRAPVDFPGQMAVGGVKVPVTVKGMASSSLFIETPLAPVDPSLEILVTFEIRTGDGPQKIYASCSLQKIQAPEIGLEAGIIVRLLATRVPEHKALLGRLAEWIRKQG
jgi:hypothetical protein